MSPGVHQGYAKFIGVKKPVATKAKLKPPVTARGWRPEPDPVFEEMFQRFTNMAAPRPARRNAPAPIEPVTMTGLQGQQVTFVDEAAPMYFDNITLTNTPRR